jgi:AcrR family transcriptional regulator
MHINRVDVQSGKARTRTALLDAAERSLARFGYAKLTMELIAEEAGLARRTAYLYFRGKEEVVLGTVDRIVDRVSARLTTLAALAAPAADRLQRMLVARVMVRAEGVQDYHRALDNLFAALRATLLERRRIYFAREARQLAAVVRDGQRAGELAAGDARKTADLLILCTNALLPHGLSETDFADRAALERRSRAVARLLLDGIRQPSTRHQRS